MKFDKREYLLSNPLEFYTMVALGLIPGATGRVMRGNNPSVGTALALIWEQGGLYTYLTANTELFISSSNAGDTTQTVEMEYLDSTYAEKTVTATLNGQNQVSIATDVFRVQRCINSSGTDFAGDIYLAETDTLTAGVPDTASKIKDKIGSVNGSGTSRNQSLSAIFTVPAGKTWVVHHHYVASKKLDDMTSTFRFRAEGKVFRALADAHVFENTFTLPTLAVVTFPEKMDLQTLAISSIAASEGDTATYGILFDNNIWT